MPVSPVTVMGSAARNTLAHAENGAVCSGHAAGIYCRFENGEIILLHDAKYGVIPFGLGCVPPPGGWKDIPYGAGVTNDPATDTLFLDGRTYVYADAISPQPRVPDLPPELFTLSRLRAGIAKAVPLLGADGVAAAFMDRRDALFAGEAATPPLADMWEAALWEPVQGVLSWCMAETGAAEEAVRAVVGLGPGLTPLGDDILCGLLFGAHALEAAFSGPVPRRIVTALAPEVYAAAHGNTTAQSAAFLQSAATGHVFGMLDAALASLFSGDDATMRAAFAAALDVGHSSGSGLLLGLLLAAELAVRQKTTSAG